MTTRPFNVGPARDRRGLRQGFTLLEVMISIVLVLIIILGVNQVFALTSRAIGAGNAMSDQIRSARSAQGVFVNDLGNAEIDRAPFFIINSEMIAAFRNQPDRIADLDYSNSTTPATADNTILTADLDGDGVETALPRALMSGRSHRADQIRFFSRFQGRRQTGTATSFNSVVSSGEHYIVYGHLRQPDNAAASQVQLGKEPGIGRLATAETPASNPNNFYATKWVLGRAAFLLKEPLVDATIRDARTNASVPYYRRGTSAAAGTYSPFSLNSDAGSGEQVQWAYYDLMGVAMESFRSLHMTSIILDADPNWHSEQQIGFRFTGFPTPSRPLSVYGAARTVPCMVPACTQFVVEYAGDFMRQKADGTQDPDLVNGKWFTDGAGNGTDGTIDFNVSTEGGVQKRSVRWYGFPRDVNDDGVITRNSDPTKAHADVVPLRDYTDTQLKFERVLPTTAVATNYGTQAGVPLAAQYRVAWAADTASYPRPRMIRIVMAVDDPAGRLAREQYFEYVIELP